MASGDGMSNDDERGISAILTGLDPMRLKRMADIWRSASCWIQVALYRACLPRPTFRPPDKIEQNPKCGFHPSFQEKKLTSHSNDQDNLFGPARGPRGCELLTYSQEPTTSLTPKDLFDQIRQLRQGASDSKRGAGSVVTGPTETPPTPSVISESD